MTEHQRESEWNVADWHGKMLVDCNGGKIGELRDVYVAVHAGQDIRCTRALAAPTLATGFPGYFFSSGYG